MQSYRIFIRDAAGRYAKVQVKPFEDDEAALGYARTLQDRHPKIEVWRGDEIVGETARPPA